MNIRFKKFILFVKNPEYLLKQLTCTTVTVQIHLYKIHKIDRGYKKLAQIETKDLNKAFLISG